MVSKFVREELAVVNERLAELKAIKRPTRKDKETIEAVEAYIEMLSDPKEAKEIEQSFKDAKAGRVTTLETDEDWEKFRKDLGLGL